MMAKAVGDKGRVLCVDIQAVMLVLFKKRAEQAGISNFQTILGGYEDPKLPQNKVDLILLVDAYHEFTKPQKMLMKMHETLSENGVVLR